MNSNSYHIALFACCREIKTDRHGGGYRTKSDASVAHMRKLIAKVLLQKMKITEENIIIENYLESEQDKK